MKEFEKMMHAEENGEFFDKSGLERIGADIDKFEKVLELLPITITVTEIITR